MPRTVCVEEIVAPRAILQKLGRILVSEELRETRKLILVTVHKNTHLGGRQCTEQHLVCLLIASVLAPFVHSAAYNAADVPDIERITERMSENDFRCAVGISLNDFLGRFAGKLCCSCISNERDMAVSFTSTVIRQDNLSAVPYLRDVARLQRDRQRLRHWLRDRKSVHPFVNQRRVLGQNERNELIHVLRSEKNVRRVHI